MIYAHTTYHHKLYFTLKFSIQKLSKHQVYKTCPLDNIRERVGVLLSGGATEGWQLNNNVLADHPTPQKKVKQVLIKVRDVKRLYNIFPAYGI